MLKVEMLNEKMSAAHSRRSQYSSYLWDFMEDESKNTLVFSCSNLDEAKSCSQAVRWLKNKHDLNVFIWKKNCTVYVIKA